jgi:hypothetical protein
MNITVDIKKWRCNFGRGQLLNVSGLVKLCKALNTTLIRGGGGGGGGGLCHCQIRNKTRINSGENCLSY